MNTKAVLCIDLDGTLINSNEKIHPKDIQTLEDFPQAIQPLITTGRILHSAKGVLRQNGLFLKDPFPLPGIFMNGGVAYLPNEILMSNYPFSSGTRKRLIGLAKAYPHTSFTFFGLSSVYLVNATAFGIHIGKIHFLEVQESQADEIPDAIIKVMVLEQDEKIRKQIEADAQSLDAETAYSLPYAYEINPPGINKAKTLLELLDTMQIARLPIFVVGDGENDLSLFKIAMKSFAPSSAQKNVINLADHIIQRGNNGLLLPVIKRIESWE